MLYGKGLIYLSSPGSSLEAHPYWAGGQGEAQQPAEAVQSIWGAAHQSQLLLRPAQQLSCYTAELMPQQQHPQVTQKCSIALHPKDALKRETCCHWAVY